MGTGAITEYIDLAQLTLYAFWLFFFGLVGYLHRENKREGYPLLDSHNENYRGGDLFGMPQEKTYILPHGQGTRTVPKAEPEGYELKAEQPVPAPGFPPTDGAPTPAAARRLSAALLARPSVRLLRLAPQRPPSQGPRAVRSHR